MFTREKKLIALLLTAALAFTMNTSMFAAVGAESVESAVYDADATTPSQLVTPAGYTTTEVQETLSKNTFGRPVSVNLTADATLSYNVLVPYFGKKVPKGQEGNVLGASTVKLIVKGKEVPIKKLQVKYLKSVTQVGGQYPTVSNATLIIKPNVKGLDKDLKKAAKEAAKATKLQKGGKLGAAGLIVYPIRLNKLTAKSELKAVLKGKKAKTDKMKLTLALFGKNFKFKSGKDQFNKKGAKAFEFDSAFTTLSISTNDIWTGIDGTSENSVPISEIDTSKVK